MTDLVHPDALVIDSDAPEAEDPRDERMIAVMMAQTGIDRAGAVKALRDGHRLADEMIARSSVGQALADVRDRGIDAHLADPENELNAAPRKKRKSSTSPTARTLAECRKRGWIAQVVEQHLPFPKPFGTKRDLFGVIDIVAIVTELAGVAYMLGDEPPRKAVGTIGIQATSGNTGGEHSKRRAKILAEPRARQWCEAGNRLEIWSWAKQGARGKAKRWTLRVEVFTVESWRQA